jgi:hypothetical protein
VAHAHQDQDPVAADRKADAKGLLVIFIALVLGAVHFASGWVVGI